MAKKKPELESKNNIENLSGLRKEYMKGKMIPRKEMMLKLRLVELWNAKTMSEDELDLLTTMLGREYRTGKISDVNLEVLNRIEMEDCFETCTCKTDSAPRVFYIQKDQVCKFKREEQTNPEKLRQGIVYQYTVFVEKVIPPEHQLTKELILKEERGHHAAEDMYPKEKILIHRLVLDDKWFNENFDIDENLLNDISEKEEAYVF